MAQTGYTPILIYSSSTAAAAPAAGSLTNSTLGSELAINITDGKLFYKDNANAIQVIGWKVVPTTAGGTGLTSYAQGDLLYYNSGTTLTALAKSTTATRYLSNTGTNNNPAWAQIDLTNGVTGTLPTSNGGTGLTSFTANGVVYASSTSALATGSALGFDGTNLLVGTTTTTNNLRLNEKLAIVNAGSGQYGGAALTSYAGTTAAAGSVLDFQRSRGTTNGSMTAVASGDSLAYLVFRGSDGTAFRDAAYIIGEVNGAVSSNIVPGRLTFWTTNTAGTIAERVRISQSGGLSVGTTSDAGATNLLVSGTATASKVQSAEGDSGAIANGATANIITLPSVGVYLVTARQAGAANGGIRAAAIVAQGSSTNGVTSFVAVGGATLVAGAGFGVDLTNTAGGALVVTWSYTKLSS